MSPGGRCPVGGVVQAECTPGREGGKLENLAKIVSAARVAQAAVPICECSWTRRCFGPDPVLRNWIVIGRSTSVWGPDPDPTATRFRGDVAPQAARLAIGRALVWEFVLVFPRHPSTRGQTSGAAVCKAGKVQNGGYVVPHPHVLGLDIGRRH